MAQVNPLSSSLRLVFDAGLDQDGDVILKPKTYQNIKTDATADQVYQVAQALASLSAYTLYMVERNDKAEIFE